MPRLSKSSAMATIRSAARRKRPFRSALVARRVPLPGRAMPSASQRQFMLLAVNMPEQEPQVGQPARSRAGGLGGELAVLLGGGGDEDVDQVDLLAVGGAPASIGPPLTKIVGMLQRTAAINMPGTILSQLGMQIMPSKQWASTIVSTQSAINSRLGSEYFMPAWPMAMPSSTPMVLKTNGVPPAWRTHS